MTTIHTSWAEHHGPKAVQALIREHPTADPEAIRDAANRYHATEDLAGLLRVCATPPPVMPCQDCTEIHGDSPDEWLNRWPDGAEYRPEYLAHLCDGCFDDRQDADRAASSW